MGSAGSAKRRDHRKEKRQNDRKRASRVIPMKVDWELRDRLYNASTLKDDVAAQTLSEQAAYAILSARRISKLVETGDASSEDHKVLNGAMQAWRKACESLGLTEEHIDPELEDL